MKSPVVVLKKLHYFVLGSLLMFGVAAMQAQVQAAGRSGSGGLDVFAMYKYTNPDLIYSPDHGIAYGAEFKLRPIFHFQPGIEGRGENDFNWKYVKWDIYSAGPYAHFMADRRLSPYAGIMFGVAHAHYHSGTDTGFELQPGVGASYRITHRFSAMADFQYHFVDFGTHNGVDTTFTPWSINFGVSYKVF